MGVHHIILVLLRRRHLGRRVRIAHHHVGFAAEMLLIIFERSFTIAAEVQIGRDHRLLLAGAYFSALDLILARPASKSLPTILSKLMNTCITFDMKGAGPLITQFRFVALPCGSIVNSAMLWASNGLRKSSWIFTSEGELASRISMRPEPTFLL